MKCVLPSGQTEEAGMDEGVYEYNPQTFRKAWMHAWCARVAFEDLDADRRDAYLQKD